MPALTYVDFWTEWVAAVGITACRSGLYMRSLPYLADVQDIIISPVCNPYPKIHQKARIQGDFA